MNYQVIEHKAGNGVTFYTANILHTGWLGLTKWMPFSTLGINIADEFTSIQDLEDSLRSRIITKRIVKEGIM